VAKIKKRGKSSLSMVTPIDLLTQKTYAQKTFDPKGIQIFKANIEGLRGIKEDRYPAL